MNISKLNVLSCISAYIPTHE